MKAWTSRADWDCRPYSMVAAALGVGFVLGGGFFTRLTAGIVGAGLRLDYLAKISCRAALMIAGDRPNKC